MMPARHIGLKCSSTGCCNQPHSPKSLQHITYHAGPSFGTSNRFGWSQCLYHMSRNESTTNCSSTVPTSTKLPPHCLNQHPCHLLGLGFHRISLVIQQTLRHCRTTASSHHRRCARCAKSHPANMADQHHPTLPDPCSTHYLHLHHQTPSNHSR